MMTIPIARRSPGQKERVRGESLLSPSRRLEPPVPWRSDGSQTNTASDTKTTVEMSSLWKPKNGSHRRLGNLAQNARFPHFHSRHCFS
jgi:hypothetical protein